MENETEKKVEAAPKAKKSCECGDLRTFFIALLTSIIVVAGYHMARQAVRCVIRCASRQQIQQMQPGPCACPCPRCPMRRFRQPPMCAPCGAEKPCMGKPGFPGKPHMGKPGFPGKRRFGRKPAPGKCDAKPNKCDAKPGKCDAKPATAQGCVAGKAPAAPKTEAVKPAAPAPAPQK